MKFRVEKKSASIYEIISNPLKLIEKESLKIARCAATDIHASELLRNALFYNCNSFGTMAHQLRCYARITS